MLLNISLSRDVEYTELNKLRLSFYTTTPHRLVVNYLLTQQSAFCQR